MKGFSLLELITSLALAAVTAVLLMAGVQGARASAGRARCVANLRAIGQAAAAYSADREILLPWYTYQEGYWWTALQTYAAVNAEIYHCPADKNFSASALDRTISYGWNYVLTGNGDLTNDFVRPGIYPRAASVLLAADGPGGAAAGQEDSWGYLDARDVHTPDPSRHNQKAHALFLDGHVEALRARDFINNLDFSDRERNKL